jgi:hypothetical protein
MLIFEGSSIELAVTTAGPLIFKRPKETSFVELVKTIPFKFSKISKISSRTPVISENSSRTPAMRIAVMAVPPKSSSKTLRNKLPIEIP